MVANRSKAFSNVSITMSAVKSLSLIISVEEHGLKVVNDTDALTKTIEELLEKNPQSVADFKAGKEKAMGFIVGQTMRAMKGKADPAVVNQLVRELMSR